MRATVLTVVPRVVRILSRIRQAEAQVPAPATADQRVEEPVPVIASPVRVQKTPTRRWQITRSVKRKSPRLCPWRSPRESRGPPSHFGGSRSWAYLYRRSFPINNVDPSGLDWRIYVTHNGPQGGHTYIGVGKGNKWVTFGRNIKAKRSEEKCDNKPEFKPQFMFGSSEPGLVESPDRNFSNGVGDAVKTFKTSPREDKKMLKYLNDMAKSETEFGLSDHNCATFVRDALTTQPSVLERNGIDPDRAWSVWTPSMVEDYVNGAKFMNTQEYLDLLNPRL